MPENLQLSADGRHFGTYRSGEVSRSWATLPRACACPELQPYIPLGVYVPLFQDRIFHLDAAARGMVSAANAAATLLGVLKSGKWTQTLVRRSQGAPLGLAGVGLIGTGLLTLLYAATPWLVLSLLIGAAAFFSFGVVTVAAVTVQAAVSPPNVRTLSFSFSSFFAIAGAAVFLATPLAQVSDHMGIRWAVGFTAPFWVVAGLVLYFARRRVEADTIASNASRRADTPSTAGSSSDRLLPTVNGQASADGNSVEPNPAVSRVLGVGGRRATAAPTTKGAPPPQADDRSNHRSPGVDRHDPQQVIGSHRSSRF